jgi:hypothetical protein
MKSHRRFSKASGSTKRRVDDLIQRGWYPGCRMKPNRRSRWRDVRSQDEAINRHEWQDGAR